MSSDSYSLTKLEPPAPTVSPSWGSHLHHFGNTVFCLHPVTPSSCSSSKWQQGQYSDHSFPGQPALAKCLQGKSSPLDLPLVLSSAMNLQVPKSRPNMSSPCLLDSKPSHHLHQNKRGVLLLHNERQRGHLAKYTE